MPAGAEIRGIPFVPGRARGPVRLREVGADDGGIRVVRQDQIHRLEGRPDGLVVVEAAPFSHAMIGILAQGIPTVLVDARQVAALEGAGCVELDGATGRIALGGEPCLPLRGPGPAPPAAGRPLYTADGEAVSLRASVRSAEQAHTAVLRGAASIGLVRSEFLLPEGGPPVDVAYWQARFGALCEAAFPLPLAVRLLDLAPDKRPDWLPDVGARGAIGLQGLRLFGLAPVDRVVDAQLEALVRLSEVYELRVILPYVTGCEELEQWMARTGRRLPERLPISAMAEIPASALDLGCLLDQAAFAALGCNDLMQALFSADRDQPRLRGYLDPYAPVLYRFLAQVAEASAGRLGRVQVCGVLSQIQGVLPLLLGLGYRVFSVDTVMIPWLAHIVSETRLPDARVLVERACLCRSAHELRALLELPA